MLNWLSEFKVLAVKSSKHRVCTWVECKWKNSKFGESNFHLFWHEVKIDFEAYYCRLNRQMSSPPELLQSLLLMWTSFFIRFLVKEGWMVGSCRMTTYVHAQLSPVESRRLCHGNRLLGLIKLILFLFCYIEYHQKIFDEGKNSCKK